MSAGKVHTQASIILAGSFLLTGAGEPAIGALIGILISPDLDVDNGFTADTYIRNQFGRALEFVWDIVWWPYRKLFKHGSFASHFPIVGTLGRLVYLFVVGLLVPYFILSLVIPGAWSVAAELNWWWERISAHPRLFIGLAGADLIHWALDVSTTEHKQ